MRLFNLLQKESASFFDQIDIDYDLMSPSNYFSSTNLDFGYEVQTQFAGEHTNLKEGFEDLFLNSLLQCDSQNITFQDCSKASESCQNNQLTIKLRENSSFSDVSKEEATVDNLTSRDSFDSNNSKLERSLESQNKIIQQDLSQVQQKNYFHFSSKSKMQRRRTKKEKDQLEYLEQEFEKNPNWDKAKMEELSKILNFTPSQIYKWNWDRKMSRDLYFIRNLQSEKKFFGNFFQVNKKDETCNNNKPIFKIVKVVRESTSVLEENQ